MTRIIHLTDLHISHPDVGDAAHGGRVELAVSLGVLEDHRVHGGVAAVGDHGDAVLELIVVVPHLAAVAHRDGIAPLQAAPPSVQQAAPAINGPPGTGKGGEHELRDFFACVGRGVSDIDHEVA